MMDRAAHAQAVTSGSPPFKTCPDGFELKQNEGRSGCYLVRKSGELQRGPVEFPVATDKQLDGLRILDIQEGFKDLNVYPLQKEQQLTYKGWVVASNLSEKTIVKIPKSMQQLPEPYTFVGQNKCHFARLVHSPASVVQPGDLLIYFEPGTQEVSHSLYRNMVQGMGHAAVVTKNRKGEVMHVDAPRSWSGTSFSGKSFHILRLRPYPKEIKSKDDLEKWLADPEKRERLRVFITERNFRVAAINYYANRLYEKGYQYGFEEGTKVLTSKEWIEQMIRDGKTEDLKFYCSEFAYTPWALAGVSRPASKGVSDTLRALNAFISKTSTKEKISKDEAISNGISDMAIEYNGSSNVVANAILKVLVPPKKFLPEGGKAAIEDILKSTPEEAERKLRRAPESVRKWLSENTVGPSDFFNEIYNPNSDYFYVGTYVDGGLAETRNKTLNEGQKDRSVGQCE